MFRNNSFKKYIYNLLYFYHQTSFLLKSNIHKYFKTKKCNILLIFKGPK